MDCVIGSSLVWFSILLHCILTPLSISQTSQAPILEGTAFMEIFNRSKCQPRWVLLNLLNEFPQFSDLLFKPPCVSVLRCAGCCLDEAQSCFPIQSNIIRMEVQVHKNKSDRENTEIAILQHTECECRPHAYTMASRLISASGDKKAKKRRRKGKKGRRASQNARSICQSCGRRRTLNPKNCQCVCDLNEKKCNRRGLTLNTERCRCETPRS